jgi:hypothetical protein
VRRPFRFPEGRINPCLRISPGDEGASRSAPDDLAAWRGWISLGWHRGAAPDAPIRTLNSQFPASDLAELPSRSIDGSTLRPVVSGLASAL